MERLIESIRLQFSNLQEFQSAITKLTQSARYACNGMQKAQPWQGMSAIHVQDQDSFLITHVDLIEETLTDGSKVFNLRFDTAPITRPQEVSR